jgi:Ca-activated chloride channel family protein
MGDPAAAGEQALDEATLEAVAETTGGEYFHADDREELDGVYALLDQLNPKQVETQSYRPERELYFWPLGVAVIVSLLFFGQAELRSLLRNRREPERTAPGTGQRA